MQKTLTQKFMDEISKIKKPEYFLGISKILGAPLMKNKDEPYEFLDIFSNVVEKYNKLNRQKQRELLKLLRKANKQKGEINGGTKEKD